MTRKLKQRSNSTTNHDRAGLKGLRGLPKKGGAGGNYTWGKPGDEQFIPEMDREDPNYNSETDEKNIVFLSSDNIFNRNVKSTKSFNAYNELTSKSASYFNNGHQDFSYLNAHSEILLPPKLTLPQFKKQVTLAIEEFFVSEDSGEFLTSVEELDSRMFHYELVKKIIISSMSKSDRERELTSKILSLLQVKNLLSTNQVAKGFERLLENIDDIMLDIPNAKLLLAQFIAKCVADDVLPPAFLQNEYIQKLSGNGNGTKSGVDQNNIIEHAKVLLTMKHGLTRLEHIWNLNVSSPLKDLKDEIKLIITEYFSTENLTEAEELLQKLNIPFFMHEVVKRGVILSMEKTEREQAMISLLIKHLSQSDARILSESQAILGFQRLYEELFDIKLDNPDAETVLEIFANQAVNDGVFSKQDLEYLKKRAEEISIKDQNDLDLLSKQRIQSERQRGASM